MKKSSVSTIHKHSKPPRDSFEFKLETGLLAGSLSSINDRLKLLSTLIDRGDNDTTITLSFDACNGLNMILSQVINEISDVEEEISSL